MSDEKAPACRVCESWYWRQSTYYAAMKSTRQSSAAKVSWGVCCATGTLLYKRACAQGCAAQGGEAAYSGIEDAMQAGVVGCFMRVWGGSALREARAQGRRRRQNDGKHRLSVGKKTFFFSEVSSSSLRYSHELRLTDRTYIR